MLRHWLSANTPYISRDQIAQKSNTDRSMHRVHVAADMLLSTQTAVNSRKRTN